MWIFDRAWQSIENVQDAAQFIALLIESTIEIFPFAFGLYRDLVKSPPTANYSVFALTKGLLDASRGMHDPALDVPRYTV